MTLYRILGLLALAIVTFLFFSPKSKSVLENFFISTQSQSNDRVKKLNLDKPSEDVSYILDTNKLLFPEISTKTEKLESKADPEREWIINLIPTEGALFKKDDLDKMFDYDWRCKYQSTIYGYSNEEKSWRYTNTGDAPNIFSKLQVAINLQDLFIEDSSNYEPQKLKRYLDELEKKIKKYPTKLKIEETESIESAITKAKGLVRHYQEFNKEAIIVLKADKYFNGLEMWDALQSIGLEWGDGDLFHWSNSKGIGPDQHFSVWTTTEPGYFLPEEIENGNMNPQNLVFGFAITGSVDPKNVFEIMINAVKYTHKRIGGQILDKNLKPFNEKQEKQDLSEFLKKLEKNDLKLSSEHIH